MEFFQILTHGSGVELELDPTRLLLAFETPPENIEALVEELGLQLETLDANDGEAVDTSLHGVVNHTDRRFWVRSSDRLAINIEHIVAALEGLLEWVGPVYAAGARTPGNLLCPLPNALLVRFESRQPDPAALKSVESRGVTEVTEKSQYLAPYRYFTVDEPLKKTSHALRPLLEMIMGVIDVRFENMPMIRGLAITPNDQHFALQWNMTQIGAGGTGRTAWDITTGQNNVVIAILDEGCDLTHPDLTFLDEGINLGTMLPPGAPTGPHGTTCAGIAAARFDNAEGISGVAGGCSILPIAFQNWTDVEGAAGINYAVSRGARVLSMSFGYYAPGEGLGPVGWDFAIVDPAIVNAVTVEDVVLCAATGNENTGMVNRYPARHSLVIACGGSDRTDNRKSPTSPDGENWGASFGPDVSVVAPCVMIPTTDNQGTGGYNSNSGGPIDVAGVNYPSSGDAAGNYYVVFNGTSAATPHVAGLAALIRSINPTLNAIRVRSIIERTAEKVGNIPYTIVHGFPNGPRNNEMGYGRINALHALDQADVMIRDWTADPGTEPSSPPGGVYWDFSDIAVRPQDDDVFVPTDINRSNRVERGQDNYLYVRVVNNGPQMARNVSVEVRITPVVGLQFVFPVDWMTEDSTHVRPAPMNNTFAALAARSSAVAKFRLTTSQVETLWGWTTGWHPCLLASVTAENDYAFTGLGAVATPQTRWNNLAQRNLSVVDLVSARGEATAPPFPLLAGHRANTDTIMELVVDRSELPLEARVLLSLDEDGSAFPLVDYACRGSEPSIKFLERTRIETNCGLFCQGVLTLERGSRFDYLARRRLAVVDVAGGQILLQGDRRLVDVRNTVAFVRVTKAPEEIYPLAIQVSIPGVRAGQQFALRVSQRNERGETVGGATVVYLVK